MNGFYWIYLAMFVLLLVSALADTKERRMRLYYMGCGLLILLYAAQDASVSVDVPVYMERYGVMAQLPWTDIFSYVFEFGFVILNKLLALLFEGDRIVLLVMGILILMPFGALFERESPEPMMALMCFLALGIYMHALIYLRQLFAMAILTISYRFVRQRRLLPFLLTVAAAMTIHKSAVVFVILYPAYALPVNRRLLIAAGAAAAVMGALGRPLLWFISHYIYPAYLERPELLASEGGWTMLAVLWIFTLLVYWLMRDRLEEPAIKLPFLMLLAAAVLQPVAVVFYNFSRIVLYFRVAMVLLIPELYVTVFRRREGNRLLDLLQAHAPGLHQRVLRVYDRRAFQAAVQAAVFAVLFLWYVSELDGAVYTLAPVIQGVQ